MEKDLILDFIGWLENKKRIYLIDITDNKDRFVTEGSNPSQFDGLDELIDEYSQDTDV